ncbi:MAG: orotidine-5'-phosphate decarboxylase [Desulfobacterales bacterium]|jgi:orotidine-5'-phosphate decarboxylase|nr:orotidine-5'-phosphate decarboxylase [Desulfobacteraceae bacterium]MBT4364335.1 orotidine-5'-phosphate decarboxylase [Desulfobacteraceae bacterium]MBT7085795.1 orotidine-5'-phosphate decarboxylase [Desulfobacterales bacterium]MBT7697953.1 orotidine-5'-phosphate decarboxylase [Desulfobacterales bacterium]
MKKLKDYLIFPLDVPSEKEARRYIEVLSDHVGIFKVGLELFIKAGPEIVKYITEAKGSKVFLDLKLHDIPETVFRSMKIISDLNVTYATVHCGESADMLQAAVEGSNGKVGVLGVTILTSVTADDLTSSGFKEEFTADMTELVLKRAAIAKKSGCTGIVCSGLEVKNIKESLGRDFITITPGIRPEWEIAVKDDQKRVATPASAIKDGSDHLVIGRPIRDAKDPKEAACKIIEEISKAL